MIFAHVQKENGHWIDAVAIDRQDLKALCARKRAKSFDVETISERTALDVYSDTFFDASTAFTGKASRRMQDLEMS